MGLPLLPGRDTAGRVTVWGGSRGCRKVHKNLDGTLMGICKDQGDGPDHADF